MLEKGDSFPSEKNEQLAFAGAKRVIRITTEANYQGRGGEGKFDLSSEDLKSIFKKPVSQFNLKYIVGVLLDIQSVKSLVSLPTPLEKFRYGAAADLEADAALPAIDRIAQLNPLEASVAVDRCHTMHTRQGGVFDIEE